MNALFAFTTPQTQPNILGVIFGNGGHIEIDPVAGTCSVPYILGTGPTSPVPGTASSLTVQLTDADLQSILQTILARANASGVMTTPGTVSVSG